MLKYSTKLISGKLMLVSRDIQVGDKCKFIHPTNKTMLPNLEQDHEIINLQYSNYKPFEVHTNKGFGPKEGYFKILGEIDPDSTVQDGEEIEEERIVELDICPNYGGRHLWKDCSCKMGFVKGYHIRKK